MAESLDFQINDLKFRAAISDKTPYARATAPFRKEQFDSAPTVGDQSLAGWWTRGQLSFHKGAGIKYYEVLEGDEVLNRFHDSTGVDIVPGEVGLADEPEALALGANVTDAAAVISGSTPHMLFATTAGLKTVATKDWSTVTSVSLSAGTTAGSFTASLGTVYMVNGSKIEKWSPGDSTTTVLWTHGTNQFRYVFYGKRRLWAVDSVGLWYMLDTAGSATALADTDAFGDLSSEYTLTTLTSMTWSFAETPGPVMLAGPGKVWSVTLDETAGVPEPTPPVTVANLPSGEGRTLLEYLLGHLVIVTANRVRFAQVAENGVGIVYGPAIRPVGGDDYFVTGEPSARGTRVYVACARSNATDAACGWLTFDLQHMVGDLEPSWFFASSVDDWPALPGVVQSGDYMIAWRTLTSTVWRVYGEPPESTRSHVTEGFVQTALHRFGTLDEKHFQAVTVHAAGDGGEIDVYLEGNPTPVGTIAPSQGSATFNLGLSAPTDQIALRFVLKRDTVNPTLSPILVGYQIKALPSPKRQRLIQWPVVAADAYRDRYGKEHGRRDGAWDAWTILEQLEESDALVTYTDHRTGETGEAYIESVELQSDTPSQGATSGFGGVGMITLRKVG